MTGIHPRLWDLLHSGAYWTRLEASRPGRADTATASIPDERTMSANLEAHFEHAPVPHSRQGIVAQRALRSEGGGSTLRGVRSS